MSGEDLLYIKEKCIYCGLCEKACPEKIIEVNPEERYFDIFSSRCTYCKECVESCPVQALVIDKA